MGLATAYSRGSWALFASLFLSTCLVSAPVRANGRFPGASQVVIDPGDRKHVVLRSTFGILDSRDTGDRMRWICEEAAFFSSVSYDPAIALARNGIVIVGLANGLSRSTQGGCEWEKIPGILDGQFVIDVSVDPQGRALAVTSEAPNRGRFATSDDDGATWKAVPLPEDFDALTVDAAPGRPSRVYASGRVPFAQFGGLARSDDGGATWTLATFDLRGGREAYISAVDPNNADRLWIRVTGDADRLLVSIDGGTTFREVLSASGPLYGFALAPDGLRLAVSSPADGIAVADSSSHAFVNRARLDARCLAWSSDGLYACAPEPPEAYTLGLFRDTTSPVDAKYRLKDTEPLACPATTRTGRLCPSQWPSIAERLGKNLRPDPSYPTPVPTPTGAPPQGTSSPERLPESGCTLAAPSNGEMLLSVSGVAALVGLVFRRSRKAPGRN
jgi:hypothetical protein